MGFSDDPAGSLSASVDAGERSIALDDRSAYGHAFLGVSLVWARQHDRGMSELERAVDLNPNSAITHFNYANGAGFSGRPLDAKEHLRIGMCLSPRDPLMSLWLCTQALAHLLVRELDEAVTAALKAAQLDPGNIRAHLRHACALAHSERLDEARQAFDKASELNPRLNTAYIDMAYPFRNSEDRAYFLDGLGKAGLPD
jgi:adenylate cyclase